MSKRRFIPVERPVEKVPPSYSAWRIQKMQDALNLVLLFHSGGPWGLHKQTEWNLLSRGREEVTSRTLCDCVREALTEDDYDERRL